LTYDPAQPNLGTIADQGLYGEYDFRVTVQTADGPVTLGAPVSWPCPGCAFSPMHVFNDVSVTLPYVGPVVVDAVHNAGSDVLFLFQDLTHTALASDSFADVDWQNLFTLSKESSKDLEQTWRPKIALRASTAADVVEGRIDTVDVQTIPSPVPEPSSILLLGVGIIGLLLHRQRGTVTIRDLYSLRNDSIGSTLDARRAGT
jgi:PEP-CTERM motif-containing protein